MNINRIGVLLIFSLQLAGCCTQQCMIRERIGDSAAKSSKKLVLVPILGSDDSDPLSDPTVQRLILENYIYAPVFVSWSYDEVDLRHTWFRKYRQNVTFEEYLHLKDLSFNDEDLKIFKVFSITKTPTYIIADTNGAERARLVTNDFDERLLNFLQINAAQ